MEKHTDAIQDDKAVYQDKVNMLFSVSKCEVGTALDTFFESETMKCCDINVVL